MIALTLIRSYYPTHTYGTFTVEGESFSTIERPWLNNRSNISCIPEGHYITKYLPRSSSGKYKRVWHVQSVLKRSGILIHNGNFVSHSRGCLILGTGKSLLGGKPAVVGSRKALRKLREVLGEDDLILNIVGKYSNPKCTD